MSFREVKNPVDFPKMEKEILDFWEKNRIFEKSVKTRPENKPFIFYEGPPTANGRPGIHHVISRSVKDFVCRYKTMQGYRVSRKAGWDTHGLPVEIEIEKELGFQTKAQIEDYGVDKFNKKCRESVFRYLKEWNELTRRIGYWVDLEHPYITYTSEYIESIWWLLAEIWKKGLLYQGFKILPYCPRCETALSSHETSLGYEEVTERALTVKFPLKDKENHYILAWTTTPWTLPGNVALAVGAKIPYVEVAQKVNGRREVYYLAENRLEILEGEYEIVHKFPGQEMEGWQYHPLFDFVNLADPEHPAYYVALADFVTTEEGTGVVHTAVMYGEDDYKLGLEKGLPAKHTVDEMGEFNELVSRWQGRFVKDSGIEHEIVTYLSENRRLYKEEQYTHTYPHCWRCDSPLLYYAKKSWYLKTTEIKDQLLKNNQDIQWYPREVGEGRFGQWLESNVDWALSRERYWGTPLNVWICDHCKNQLAVESIEVLKKLSGLDDIPDLHKPTIDEIEFPCPECKGKMTRTPEVIDCWFDSGAMPYAQFHYPFEKNLFEKNFPADFISEGIDQTRGWFYSLLAIATLVSGKSAYKRCLSIEMILDKDGLKMSKRRGNAVDPNHILNRDGADPLRWYLFTVSPPWVPTRFNEEGIQEVLRKFFVTLTNTYSFFVLYANIDGFEYKENSIPVKKRPEIDRWLISALNSLVKGVNQNLERFEITRAARQIQDFVIDDLSNWYVRRNRRRFWKSAMGEDKLAAYQTLYETLFIITKLIAPFIPFLSDEMFQNLNSIGTEKWESVHLTAYPSAQESQYRFTDPRLEEKMGLVKETVSLCRSARNEAKIRVRQPLGRAIVVAGSIERQNAIQSLEHVIKEEVNVHQLCFSEDSDQIMIKRAKPNFKTLGPKFGKQVNIAKTLIQTLAVKEIEKIEKGEKIKLKQGHHILGEIDLNDIEVVVEAVPGLVIQSNGNLTVALDVTLDNDLLAEGLAREVVNRVQNMRKQAGFDVTDRIQIYFDSTDKMIQAIQEKDQYIREETLAVHLENQRQKGDYYQEWEIEDEKIKIGIKRVQ